VSCVVVLAAGLLSFAVAGPALAQGTAQPFEPWRINGEVFLSYDRLAAARDSTNQSVSKRFGGGFYLNLHGHVLDPRFLIFDVGGNFEALGNGVDREEFSTRIAGYQVTTRFLSQRPWPLTVRFTKNGVGNSSDTNERLNFQNDFTTFSLNWQLSLPDKPKITATFDRTENTSDVTTLELPVSENRVRAVGLVVSHDWRNWDFRGNFIDVGTQRDFGGGLSTDRKRDRLNVTTARAFGQEARLRLMGNLANNRDLLADDFGGGTKDAFAGANLSISHTARLTGNYDYNFQYSEFDLQQPGLDQPGTISFASNNMNAQLAYRLSDQFTLLGDVGGSLLPVPNEDLESLRWRLRVGPGISFRQPSRYLTFGASYQPVWNAGVTNREVLYTAWSHVVNLNAEGGDRRFLAARVTYRYSNAHWLYRRGAQDRRNVFRVSLETRAIPSLALRAGYHRHDGDILGLNGLSIAKTWGWDVTAEHRFFSAGVGKQRGLGEQLVFADPLERVAFSTVPLPVDTLVASPFGGHIGDARYAFFTFRPSADLRITARYREDTSLFTSTEDLENREWDIFAEYRFGKFWIRAGYLDWDQLVGFRELQTQRYYFRVSRTIDFFPFM